MICLSVRRNGHLICTAGIVNACLLSIHIAGGLGDDEPAFFDVSGMQDLSEERNAHVYWIRETPLSDGDHFSFSLCQSDDPSPPVEIIASDSPGWLDGQNELAEFEKTYMGPQRPPEIRWPELELRLKFKNEDLVAAKLLDGEEHISCSILWDKWQPDQCHVSVQSFTGCAAGMQHRTTAWLRGNLCIEDSFEVSVCT